MATRGRFWDRKIQYQVAYPLAPVMVNQDRDRLAKAKAERSLLGSQGSKR